MPTGVPQRERPRAKPPARSHPAPARARSQDHRRQRDLTVALDRAIDVVIVPVAGVGRVLSARAGLVRYAQRGVLAAAELMAWPVAAAAGLGSAAASHWGVLRQPPAARRAPATRSTPANRSTPAARPRSPVRSQPSAGRNSPVRSKPAARARSGVRRTGAL